MFINVNGVRLFFDVLNPKLALEGDGLREKPTLVCLHGMPGGDHQSLRPTFDQFSDVAQVVYLDQRGGGRSEHGDPVNWNLNQWGDDVAVFCNAVGIAKPIIIGVSGGSIVAQAYLSRHPQHAGAVVLVNPCSRMTQEGLVAAYAAVGGPQAAAAAQAMYGQPGPDDYAAFFKHCLPLYSHRRDLSSLAATRNRATSNPQASQRFFAPGGEAFSYDHRGVLGSGDCPVLLLVGAHDPVTPPQWGREVADALPPGRAELHLFEGSSHLIWADEPDRFYATIRRFIAAR